MLIRNATIINEGRAFAGSVEIDGERIARITEGEYTEEYGGKVIDAKGLLLLPGVIDTHVHFRDPGLTHKGDIHSESVAAVAGGVTSFMDMPNTDPPTVTLDALEQKFEIAAEKSLANYSFYFGATNENASILHKLDAGQACGVKLFMGSSTGNMLVDNRKSLSAIFAESPLIIAAHCEDEKIIRENTAHFKSLYGDTVSPSMHVAIRSHEACYRATAEAIELACKYGSRLHAMHLSTYMELALFESKPLKDKKITSEVCVHHLWFSEQDYDTKGNLIKWNPSVKCISDREELRKGINGERSDVVATDHAPHTSEEKMRPYWQAPSGGPMVQHSLVAMLEMAKQGVFTFEKVVEKMCHAPAELFGISGRGFIREGYFADLVIVDPAALWRVDKSNILYKCGWSPMEGTEFCNRVVYTIINGSVVNSYGEIDRDFRGKALQFRK